MLEKNFQKKNLFKIGIRYFQNEWWKLIRKLEWDSNFWGLDIYHLEKQDNFNFVEKQKKNYLVQALANNNDLAFIKNLELSGFNFKEIKIVLEKTSISAINNTNLRIESLSIESLKPYRNIFFEMFGKNSRFDIFPEEKVNNFYYIWILNSITGKMDDECIGLFLDDKLAGFATYKVNNGKMKIGLLGVFPNYQGKSVSQLLLQQIDNIAHKKEICSISIATQGKNIKAINAYIKNGYKIKSIDQWYYLLKED